MIRLRAMPNIQRAGETGALDVGRTSSPSRSRLEGWPIVGLSAAVLVAMVGALLLALGTGEAAIRTVVRATAQTSLALFLLAFTASSLRRLSPTPATAWLLRNRRYVGVSFAVSHLLHLVAVLVVARRWPQPFTEQSGSLGTLVGGGLGYLFIAAMAATSFDRSAAWVGARRWRMLHTVGSYYVWLIFAGAYVAGAVQSPERLPLGLFVLGALAVRLLGKRRRSPRPAVASPAASS